MNTRTDEGRSGGEHKKLVDFYRPVTIQFNSIINFE